MPPCGVSLFLALSIFNKHCLTAASVHLPAYAVSGRVGSSRVTLSATSLYVTAISRTRRRRKQAEDGKNDTFSRPHLISNATDINRLQDAYVG